MFLTPLQDIDFQHVEAFCRTWPEGVRVEYKLQLVQVPKIISSFANTVGGIWLVGVETGKATNLPVLPIRGMPAQAGFEEQVTQTCWNGIYPPLMPAIKVIPLPSDPGRVVVVVKVSESTEAPHAIENTTRVYIRVNSVTEPIQLADIDRIEYLLNRRRDPEQRREQMIAAATKRSGVDMPCIRVVVGPKYPYGPLLTEDELERRLEEVQPWRWRRIQQGFISVAAQPVIERFEVNLYGLICYTVSFPEEVVSSRCINPCDVIYAIGRILHRAASLLKETTTNLFIRACLEGVDSYAIVPDPELRVDRASNPHHAIEDLIVAEKSFPRETLDKDFRTHVTDLVRQLMWAFDWADGRVIAYRVGKMVKSQWGR